MPPPRPSGTLLRAQPPRRCPRSRQAHSPGSGSRLSGSHTPQGLALRQPALHARLQPSPSELRAPSSAPAHQPVTPLELRPHWPSPSAPPYPSFYWSASRKGRGSHRGNPEPGSPARWAGGAAGSRGLAGRQGAGEAILGGIGVLRAGVS